MKKKNGTENQILNNPFPFSNTNKRYHTLSYYFKQKYGRKVAKIPLDAGFTCPNRDGSKASGGCTFCSSRGSGDTILYSAQSLEKQFAAGMERMHQKWPDALGIPYFQAYTNTYAPLSFLQEIYTPFLCSDQFPALAIATRADCLQEDFLDWLCLFPEKEVWIELGLQSVHESTMQKMNRQHSTAEVLSALQACRKRGLKVCLHLINGLPGETREMMLETAKTVAEWKPDAIKIHMLHVIEHSLLACTYRMHPFPLLTQEEYVQIVCDQLELLPAETVIERVTGDAVKEDLIAPEWTLRKTAVANDIDKELAARNSWQSRCCPFLQTEK